MRSIYLPLGFFINMNFIAAIACSIKACSRLILYVLVCIFALPAWSASSIPTLSPEQLQAIGKRIYQNETGGTAEHLIAWNQGEAFASLGIGHFIWFPADLESPFTETFPSLLAYFKQQGVVMPEWLQQQQDFPWQSKQAYLDAKNSPRMQSLRSLLLNTFELQVSFIYQRMQNSLPMMLEHAVDIQQQTHVKQTFLALAQSPLGMYALIDYVNFKGEGVSPKERYNGHGWGLLQVLAHIPPAHENIHKAFSQACDAMLTRRVAHSPQQDVEQKWLAGWRKRCTSYEQDL